MVVSISSQNAFRKKLGRLGMHALPEYDVEARRTYFVTRLSRLLSEQASPWRLRRSSVRTAPGQNMEMPQMAGSAEG